MAALATDTVRLVAGAKTLSIPIKNAAQLYVGSFTSVLAGFCQPFAGAIGETLVGRCLPTPSQALPTTAPFQLTGNTSPASGLQVPEATICTEEEVLKGVSVTGVGAQTSLMSVVYLNSTDNDLTLTRPARGIPFGVVSRWTVGTTCDVKRFAFDTLLAIMLAGNGSDTVYLGTFTPTTAAAGVTVAAVTLPYRARIRTIYANIGPIALTGGTSVTITGSTSAGAFTAGGVLALTTNAAGALVSCTAITQDAAATVSESQTVNLSWTSVGTYTAGTISVFATVDHQPAI